MRKNWIIWATLPLLALACAKADPVQEEQSIEPVELSPMGVVDATPFVPGVAHVYVTEPFAQRVEKELVAGEVTKADGLGSQLDELGILSMTRLFPDAGPFEERTRREGLHRWYTVVYDPAKSSLTKATHSLYSLEGIETVEGIHKIRSTSAVFDDPKLSSQWGYINKSYPGVDINVDKVWKDYTTGDPKVIVSVVDGGIQQDHEDLVGNLIPGGPNGSKNFVTGGYVITEHSHGTHVAGTIAAVNNNGIGVCGIAGGNAAAGQGGVRLMSCQVFTDDDSAHDFAAALKWGADNGAVISQNSWGYVIDLNDNNVIEPDELERAKSLTIDSALKSAVDYFNKYAGCDNEGNQLPDSPMKGGVVIFSAGNDNIPYGPPADYEGIIAVGAISNDGKRASFSNYGDWVDIAAPGTSILSTTPGSSYGNKQGTSMACPHVSGVAALVVSYFGGPGFTSDMLRDRLLKGANANILPDNSRIGPLVDALGSIMYGNADVPEKVSEYSVTPVSNNLDFSWKVTGNSVGDPATGYVLFASKESLESLNPAQPGENVKTAVIEVAGQSVGDTMTGRLEGLDFETSYYVTIAGYDYGRNFSAIASQKTTTTEKNNPPVISTAYTGDWRIHAHEVVDIPFSVTDPDGHKLKVVFTSGGSADAWTQGAGDTYILTLSGGAANPGNYSASIKATDSYGLATTLAVPYTILENQPPVVTKNIENMLFNAAGEKFTLNMNEFINDPDGETLRYSMKMTSTGVVNLNQQGNVLYGTTLSYGLTDVTLTGTDAKGKTATLSFKVLVRNPEIVVQSYPNPVTSSLYITSPEATPVSLDVTILSATGGNVYEDTVQASAFDPAVIDVSGLAPGIYTVIITYKGVVYKQTVVKK